MKRGGYWKRAEGSGKENIDCATNSSLMITEMSRRQIYSVHFLTDKTFDYFDTKSIQDNKGQKDKLSDVLCYAMLHYNTILYYTIL